MPFLIPLIIGGAGIYAGTQLDTFSVFGFRPFDNDPPAAPSGAAGQFQSAFGDTSLLTKSLLFGAAGYASYRLIKKVTK